jgi:hypothetical protein
MIFAWDANQWITLCIKHVYLTRMDPSDSPTNQRDSEVAGLRQPKCTIGRVRKSLTFRLQVSEEKANIKGLWLRRLILALPHR